MHLLPASALSRAYRLHYPRRTSWRLLLLWVQLTSLRLHLQPFSGRRTPCLRQSHRTFFLQDLFHTQLLVDNQSWIEWLPCHSHNHRGLSQLEIPQTPRTQLIRGQLEQQNFEMMNKLQEKNQQTNSGSLCSTTNWTAGFSTTVHGADVLPFGPGTNSASSSCIFNTATSHCVNHTGVCHTACQIRGTYGRSSISTSPF